MTPLSPTLSHGLVLLVLTIPHATSAPLNHEQFYGTQRAIHSHLKHASRTSTRTEPSAHRVYARAADESNAIDPGNRYFPLVIVCIVLGALGVLVALGFIARICLNKAPERHVELGPAEKQEGISRAPSVMSRLTLSSLDEKCDVTEPPPTLQANIPLTSSVGRGIGTRHDNRGKPVPFQLYEDNYYDGLANVRTEQPSEMPPSVPSKTDIQRSSVYSFETDSGHSRQSDVANPCVTQGSEGWGIQQAQSEQEYDLSFDALPPQNSPPDATNNPFFRTLARPHGP